MCCALAALYPARGQTTGSIGFKDVASQGVVSYSGTWDVFPGECILAADRRLVVFNTGPNFVPGNTLVYKLSTNGTAWPASPTTLYTPGASITSGGTECVTTSDGNVVVTTRDITTGNPAGPLYSIVGTVSGTSGGTNNDGITWGGLVSVATGSPYGGSGIYSGPSKILEYDASTWLHASYGGFSIFTGWGISKSIDKGVSWGAVNIILASDGVNAWSEVGWIKVPAGYPNAGDLIAVIRNDRHDASAGLYLTRCTSGLDPLVAASWTAPVQLPVTWTTATVGRPTLLFVPKGASGGLFLLSRFNATPRAGYMISWDQGATWSAVRQFGGVTYNAQFWYGSAGLLSDGTIAGIVSQALNGQSTVASVVSRDFLAVAP